MASIHVEVWRNAYSGILPDHSLTGLSRRRLGAYYAAAIVRGRGVLVAQAAPEPEAAPGGPRVVGFATSSRAGPASPADGEVETLYVHDDWRELGAGRALLQASARHLAKQACRSLFLWVLADNPSRWFYEHLGGRPGLRGMTMVGGESLPQVAMIWERIDSLVEGRTAG